MYFIHSRYIQTRITNCHTQKFICRSNFPGCISCHIKIRIEIPVLRPTLWKCFNSYIIIGITKNRNHICSISRWRRWCRLARLWIWIYSYLLFNCCDVIYINGNVHFWICPSRIICLSIWKEDHSRIITICGGRSIRTRSKREG